VNNVDTWRAEDGSYPTNGYGDWVAKHAQWTPPTFEQVYEGRVARLKDLTAFWAERMQSSDVKADPSRYAFAHGMWSGAKAALVIMGEVL
jgi:hypothetical protein